jgi:hypothetical protein
MMVGPLSRQSFGGLDDPFERMSLTIVVNPRPNGLGVKAAQGVHLRYRHAGCEVSEPR